MGEVAVYVGGPKGGGAGGRGAHPTTPKGTAVTGFTAMTDPLLIMRVPSPPLGAPLVAMAVLELERDVEDSEAAEGLRRTGRRGSGDRQLAWAVSDTCTCPCQ
jgi:hypothetical protein